MIWLDKLVHWLAPLLGRVGVPAESQELTALWALLGAWVLLLVLILLLMFRLTRPGRVEVPYPASTVPPPTEEPPEGIPSEPAVEEERPAEEDVVEAAPGPAPAETAAPAEAAPQTTVAVEPEVAEASVSLLERMRSGLAKTHRSLVGRIDSLVLGRKEIDADLLEELEEILVTADLGVATTQRLVAALEERLDRGGLSDGAQLRQALKEEILHCLTLKVPPLLAEGDGPRVILMTGVNGVGKTTTIGKLANQFGRAGNKVLLGAGDTFRAAAADQLEVWADRAGCDIVRHDEGADPGAVAFDAVKAAVARKADLLLLDTAGRLHTKVNLMEELKKVCRVVGREIPGAPHVTLLVLDATTGQNALTQAKMFREAVGIDGIVLTKLDGTAKGGIVIAIAAELGLPVYYVGIGEGIEDLRPFKAELFVEALFEEN